MGFWGPWTSVLIIKESVKDTVLHCIELGACLSCPTDHGRP